MHEYRNGQNGTYDPEDYADPNDVVGDGLENPA
jgi:hypothetical protein